MTRRELVGLLVVIGALTAAALWWPRSAPKPTGSVVMGYTDTEWNVHCYTLERPSAVAISCVKVSVGDDNSRAHELHATPLPPSPVRERP